MSQLSAVPNPTSKTTEDLLYHMADTVAVRAVNDPLWKPLYDHLQRHALNRETQGWKKKTGMTQLDKLLRHFAKAGSITVREAIVEYSINALPKRIMDLRERGHPIVSVVKYHPVTGQKYVRYTYKPQKQIAA